MSAHPPKARMTFRVGVVGHRPNRLPQDAADRERLKAAIARVLAAVRRGVERFCAEAEDAELYASGGPVLVAVSSLAEGADRLFAEAGLDAGYALLSPMPFARATFVKDFLPPDSLEPHSVERFEAILERARRGAGLTIFELDGLRDEESTSEAYAAAARVVTNQSDLLVAIWDGATRLRRGGTLESVLAALDADVPVLWVAAAAPFGWRLLRHRSELEGLSRLERLPAPEAEPDAEADRERLRGAIAPLIEAELALPRPPHIEKGESPSRNVRAYFRERRPRFNLAFAWKMFRDFVGSGKFSPPHLVTRDYTDQIAGAWPVSADGLQDVSSTLNRALRDHYAWADKEADRYADAHRSGFVVASIVTPFAVGAALAPVALHGLTPFSEVTNYRVEALLTVAEGGLLLWIALILFAGWRYRWHDRWLEYRVLAEQIRQLRMITPFGGGRLRPRRRPHLASYGELAETWTAWHVRAIARALLLPDACVDAQYLRAAAPDLHQLVETQRKFHATTADRFKNIHERLHGAALLLLALSIAGVIAHFFLLKSDRWQGAFALLAAFLPALGAALASINNQGEFLRLKKRSQAMEAFFEVECESLKAMIGAAKPLRLETLAAAATRITSVMVDEVSDWRIVVTDPAASSA